VGLDVVRRNIKALGGYVTVDSVAGQSTTFALTLPLTLAIIDGLIVRTGSERYIVPITSVVESVRPARQQVSTIQERGEVIDVRGVLLPLIRLSEFAGEEGQRSDQRNLRRLAGAITGHLAGQRRRSADGQGRAEQRRERRRNRVGFGRAHGTSRISPRGSGPLVGSASTGESRAKAQREAVRVHTHAPAVHKDGNGWHPAQAKAEQGAATIEQAKRHAEKTIPMGELVGSGDFKRF
jgi:hypothetical protein